MLYPSWTVQSVIDNVLFHVVKLFQSIFVKRLMNTERKLKIEYYTYVFKIAILSCCDGTFISYIYCENLCFIEQLLYLGKCWWKLWVFLTKTINGNGGLHSREATVTVCCFAFGKCGVPASQVSVPPWWGSGCMKSWGSPSHLRITVGQTGDTSSDSYTKMAIVLERRLW
jgi:hypothetical protein